MTATIRELNPRQNTVEQIHLILREEIIGLRLQPGEAIPKKALCQRFGGSVPKMLSIGLHCRLVGRPGRIASLEKFLAHVNNHADVWLCRRIDITRHWHKHQNTSFEII